MQIKLNLKYFLIIEKMDSICKIINAYSRGSEFRYRNYSMYGSMSDGVCGRRCSKIQPKGSNWVKCTCK